MPITQREALQLGLLLLCVPLQFMLSINLSTTAAERSQLGNTLVTEAKALREAIFRYFDTRLNNFLDWLDDILQFILPPDEPDDVNSVASDESPAVEVLEYKESQGIFGTSNVARSVRSPQVLYRVGQVVRHKTTGYRAVIIGWDLTAKMPEVWLEKVYGTNRKMSNWPHYSLLIDERDHKSHIPLSGYVVQSRLELLKNTEIQHSKLGKYFKYFDGAQYIPNEKLSKLYPKD